MHRHTLHKHKRPVELTNVIYNAADQTFEALATVHDGAQSKRYACAINAPIEMSFEDAAKGLETQARRRHAGTAGLASKYITARPMQRSGRPSQTTLDWLEKLIRNPIRRAA